MRNKTDAILTTVTERSLDVLALTETWHISSADTCLKSVTPEGYAILETARPSGRGGGVAIINRKHLKSSLVSVPTSTTFENICARLTSTGPVIFLNVYRPGSERPVTRFFEELAAVLESLVIYSCPVIVGGDFNIQMQSDSDPDTRRLNDLLTSLDMVQHVRGPTHRCGGTVDLVLTFVDQSLDVITVDPPGAISDHSLVVCQLSIDVDRPSEVERLVRGWRAVGRDKLRRALEASSLCQPVSSTMNVDQLFATYDAALRDVADQLAPSHVIRRRPGRPTPWFDAECRALRRDCRRLERHFRHTQCPLDRQAWVQATRHRFQLLAWPSYAVWAFDTAAMALTVVVTWSSS